ncbi:unnamed protein product [Ilex paraguariensis]|uniref:RING-type E3 ubiquitin transferase n=1 Tax=Ilex paraguariensis TaxID=185542 RepID=A0ABC8RCR8_9AQUA
MNSTIESTDATDQKGGQSSGGFGYGMGISLGLCMLIATIAYVSYVCIRLRRAMHHPSSSHRTSIDTTTDGGSFSTTIQKGLDETTLLAYPKLLYSDAKLYKGDCIASGCSICLVDYKDTEVLRLLPDCDHFFHHECIDSWLRLHPTCPICRTSPMTSLLLAPLQEVVPSATPQN